nr:MAG TPA: hypothetical protein [Caudoviricetes sp.]DAN49723.1 MAG TPA: hypothetical protein [Caudoviricetes sp.]
MAVYTYRNGTQQKGTSHEQHKGHQRNPPDAR